MRKIGPLDALFSKSRSAILATVYSNPSREWYLSDLARHIGVTPSSLQREVTSLARAGILRRREDGNRTYYCGDPRARFLETFTGSFSVPRGSGMCLPRTWNDSRTALQSHSSMVPLRHEERPASDIDLMIIGRVALSELAPALEQAREDTPPPGEPVSLHTR